MHIDLMVFRICNDIPVICSTKCPISASTSLPLATPDSTHASEPTLMPSERTTASLTTDPPFDDLDIVLDRIENRVCDHNSYCTLHALI